jgi:hypothetical protein
MHEPPLTGVQRLAAARLVSAVARLATPAGADVPRHEAIAELHAITRDPVPLGYALGVLLHGVETDSNPNQPAVDVLRSAGADEDVAAAKLAWMRWRAEKETHNWMRRKQQGMA